MCRFAQTVKLVIIIVKKKLIVLCKELNVTEFVSNANTRNIYMKTLSTTKKSKGQNSNKF